MTDKRCTLSGEPPDVEYLKEHGGAPQPIDPVTGQHKDYWVICEDDRQKGFVRPVRRTYRHVGIRPRYPLRDLTEEEKKHHAVYGYVKFEEYPESQLPVTGRFWTQSMLNSGCGTETTMGLALAETYARDPKFYGSTFCCYCKRHFLVGEQGEFVWEDGSRVGS